MSVYSNNQYDKKSPNDAWFKIFQFITPKSQILDIGCSSGKLGAALKKEKNTHVTGIDIDKEDISLAKKNLDKVHLVDIEKDDLGFLGTFDTIIMADVIEHLVDPVAALKKIKKLLKKDAQLVFSVPNMANATTRIELLKGKFEYKDFGLLDRTHIHFYDKQELDRVLVESGLEVKKMDCTLREIPDAILKKELKSMGIELTPTLKKLLNSSEAVTYQFIGRAVKNDKPKKMTLHTTSPLDSVSVFIDGINEQHKSEIEHRDNEIKRLAEHARKLDERVLKLNEAIDIIHSSTTWKAVSKVRNLKKKIL